MKNSKNYDQAIEIITNYVCDHKIKSQNAYDTARYCLMDSVGCALLASTFKACTKLLGPIVSGACIKNGARVLGSNGQYDPVRAAFNNSALIRWVDFNDSFLAAEWAHPSDNLGGILATADYLNRQGLSLSMHDVLTCMIKAHEIQGVCGLKNSFNRLGYDHVVLVKLATVAVVTHLLGGTKEQVSAAQSQAWIDGPSLRLYRHEPNVGSRKSWAAGDATSRAVWLALMTIRGEQGYQTVLSTPKWGFYEVNFKKKKFKIDRKLGSYIMENTIFKAVFPAEIHAQTAIEGALKLHSAIKNKIDHIQKIVINTHEAAVRIISKVGKLSNPADRDHCIQYMVAVALIFGKLNAEDFEDKRAKDERIDRLRKKMVVKEDKKFTRDYLNPKKRSIANTIQIFFKDKTQTDKITIEYPYGHPRRRDEGFKLLEKKFIKNASPLYSFKQAQALLQLFRTEKKLNAMSVKDFMDLFVKKMKKVKT